MWSYSQLTAFEKCPYRLHLQNTKAPKADPTPEAAQGIAIHRNIERSIRNRTAPPDEAAFYTRLFDTEAVIHAEKKLYVNTQWEPCTAEDAWGVAVCDAVFIYPTAVVIGDFKNGKEQPIPHTSQAIIYTLFAQSHFPDKALSVEMVYLPKQRIRTNKFNDLQLAHSKDVLNRRINTMENTELKPKPNKYSCTYCSYKNVCTYATF